MAPIEKASKPVGAGVWAAVGRFRLTRADGAPARGSPRTTRNRAAAASRNRPAAPTRTGGLRARVLRAVMGMTGPLARGGAPAAAARADWRLANMAGVGRTSCEASVPPAG